MLSQLMDTQLRLAQRPGEIVGLWRGAALERDIPIERRVAERSVSINTIAAGGNASLMSIDQIQGGWPERVPGRTGWSGPEVDFRRHRACLVAVIL